MSYAKGIQTVKTHISNNDTYIVKFCHFAWSRYIITWLMLRQVVCSTWVILTIIWIVFDSTRIVTFLILKHNHILGVKIRNIIKSSVFIRVGLVRLVDERTGWGQYEVLSLFNKKVQLYVSFLFMVNVSLGSCQTKPLLNCGNNSTQTSRNTSLMLINVSSVIWTRT